MSIRSLHILSLGLILTGCAARAPEVPDNAKLIWYGASDFNLPTQPGPGQYWMYDETLGRTVAVVTLPSDKARNLEFTVLKPGHRYRLYLVDQLPPTSTGEAQ